MKLRVLCNVVLLSCLLAFWDFFFFFFVLPLLHASLLLSLWLAMIMIPFHSFLGFDVQKKKKKGEREREAR